MAVFAALMEARGPDAGSPRAGLLGCVSVDRESLSEHGGDAGPLIRMSLNIFVALPITTRV